MFFELLVGHALGDFGLQSDAMAKYKNKHNTPTNIPNGQKLVPVWYYWLCSHGLIHGGIVMLVTGNQTLGIVETILHIIIDYLKCENVTNPHVDQLLHIVCKFLYVAYLFK